MFAVIRSRAAGLRAALGAIAVGVLVAFAARGALASEPVSAHHPWPSESAVARPHLEAPAVPQPREIRLPNQPASQLLFTSKELTVPPRVRLIVFAPHPDDETLAAGGLIQRVLGSGGAVRVVFVTNGDGYVDGVRREVQRIHTSTLDFIEYGRRRHDEALRALHHFGIPPSDGIFLGFPDDGIDDLWAGHWSPQRPYTSPYTRSDRPPYKDSLSQHVEYAGADLESEIERTLRDFAPEWVLMPDPRDRHPDHCTTGVFVLDALRRLRQERSAPFDRTQVFTYLVHYPDYPASSAWVREIAGAGVGGSLTAGRVLSAAHWLHLALTSTELAGKRNAVAEYHSQIQVMNPFLKQFLRTFELFGQLDATQVTGVADEYAARFHRPR